MRWLNLAFIHWPIESNAIRRLIPSGLEIHRFDGRAWVGLVPFTMRDVLPARAPRWRALQGIRGLSAFHECNVRTYVHPVGRPDEPGVWFFSLDAASRAAVWAARRLFHLPYYFSRITLETEGDVTRYAVGRVDQPRAAMRCAWRTCDRIAPSREGELHHFLTHRLCLYSCDRGGRLWCGRIWHEPWPLCRGELISLEDGLLASAGIDVDFSKPAVVHAAEELDVHAWALEPVKSPKDSSIRV